MTIITIILHSLILSVELISITYDLKQKHQPCSKVSKRRIIINLHKCQMFLLFFSSLLSLNPPNPFPLIKIQTAVKWPRQFEDKSKCEVTFIHAEQIEYKKHTFQLKLHKAN